MANSNPNRQFARSTGTEGTYVGGALGNYKYNWDNAELSSYPRGIRENTTGQDEEQTNDNDNMQDNDATDDSSDELVTNDNDGAEERGKGGFFGSWNMSQLASAIADAIATRVA